MINEFGLYKNLVPRWKLPGFNSTRNLDDQTQGWWLPFFDNDGNIHLIDTYHIFNHSANFLDDFIKNNKSHKDNSWLISRSNSDYYYGGSFKVTDDTEKYFKLVCDLRDFKIARIDPNDYLDNDIVTGVQLYFEHGYPSGVVLLRNDAKKDPNKQAINVINKSVDSVHRSYLIDYYINTLKELLINECLTDITISKVKITIEYLEEVDNHEKLIKDALDKYLSSMSKLE